MHFGIGESGVSQACRRVAQKMEKDKKCANCGFIIDYPGKSDDEENRKKAERLEEEIEARQEELAKLCLPKPEQSEVPYKPTIAELEKLCKSCDMYNRFGCANKKGRFVCEAREILIAHKIKNNIELPSNWKTPEPSELVGLIRSKLVDVALE